MTLIKALSLLSKAFSCDNNNTFNADIKCILRIMERCKTKEEKMVVILHQLLIHGKDQGWTLERLKQDRFPITILKALYSIFPDPRDSEQTYAHKLEKNLLARRVKICEIADVLDLTQIPEISIDDLDRIRNQHTLYMKLINF